MRVLVLEAEPGAAEGAVAVLEAASHVIDRCHDSDHPGFPCKAIDAPSDCPLVSGPVDVVLTVRSEERTTTGELEDGVACAIRARVPLVVAGATEGNPYQPWATATVPAGGDVVRACQRAAAAPLPHHSRVGSERLREVLARHGHHEADSAGVEVTRRNGRLRVLLTVPAELSGRVTEAAATHVLAVVHKIDPSARGKDLSVRTIDASVGRPDSVELSVDARGVATHKSGWPWAGRACNSPEGAIRGFSRDGRAMTATEVKPQQGPGDSVSPGDLRRCT